MSKSRRNAALGIALYLLMFGVMRLHVTRWEARRPLLYHRQEVTQSILHELGTDPATSGLADQKAYLTTRSTKTREWAETLYPWDGRDIPKLENPVARVSGSNGQFSLGPIRIEIYDPLMRKTWIERLRREYDAQGWAYEVVALTDSTPKAR